MRFLSIFSCGLGRDARIKIIQLEKNRLWFSNPKVSVAGIEAPFQNAKLVFPRDANYNQSRFPRTSSTLMQMAMVLWYARGIGTARLVISNAEARSLR